MNPNDASNPEPFVSLDVAPGGHHLTIRINGLLKRLKFTVN